jgi:ubiquinol-cytochrome c reductase cytochrome b subunit
MPSFDLVVGGYTLVPNPFWGGVALPLLVFGFLYLWPWLERRFTGDQAFHNLLDRPRDAPVRTGIGVGWVTFVVLIFFAGASDRVYVTFGLGYIPQIWFYRVAIWVLPALFGFVTWWACKELQAGETVLADRHEAEAQARLAQMER